MEQITKETLEALFISLIAATLFAPVMIAFLYKYNQVSEHKKSNLGGGVEESDTNELFLKIMNVTTQNGTPNIGGILVWIIVPLMAVLLINRTQSINIFLLAFVIFGLWGFIDVVTTNKMKQDEKFRVFQEKFSVRMVRFLFSALFNILIIYLLYRYHIVENIDLKIVTISLTPLLIPVFGFIAHFAVYSAEIIDGLDGLMIGVFGIIYSGLAAMLLIQGQYEFLPLIGVILGVVIVDLYFNIPPARFFNGGPGAMTLGIGAFLIGLISNNLVPYFFMSGWTWIVMSTSLIQILSMKFFKKRVFKIAPLHHHFQAVGWPNYKVTMRFWLATLFLVVIGLYISII